MMLMRRLFITILIVFLSFQAFPYAKRTVKKNDHYKKASGLIIKSPLNSTPLYDELDSLISSGRNSKKSINDIYFSFRKGLPEGVIKNKSEMNINDMALFMALLIWKKESKSDRIISYLDTHFSTYDQYKYDSARSFVLEYACKIDAPASPGKMNLAQELKRYFSAKEVSEIIKGSETSAFDRRLLELYYKCRRDLSLFFKRSINDKRDFYSFDLSIYSDFEEISDGAFVSTDETIKRADVEKVQKTGAFLTRPFQGATAEDVLNLSYLYFISCVDYSYNNEYRTPSKMIVSGKGDCTEASFFYWANLRSVGCDPIVYFVSSAGSDYFSHVMTGVKIKNKYFFLDDSKIQRGASFWSTLKSSIRKGELAKFKIIDMQNSYLSGTDVFLTGEYTMENVSNIKPR